MSSAAVVIGTLMVKLLPLFPIFHLLSEMVRFFPVRVVPNSEGCKGEDECADGTCNAKILHKNVCFDHSID